MAEKTEEQVAEAIKKKILGMLAKEQGGLSDGEIAGRFLFDAAAEWQADVVTPLLQELKVDGSIEKVGGKWLRLGPLAERASRGFADGMWIGLAVIVGLLVSLLISLLTGRNRGEGYPAVEGGESFMLLVAALLVVVGLTCVFYRLRAKKQGFGPNTIRVIGLVMFLPVLILVVMKCVGKTSGGGDSESAVFGLLGAVAGYVLSRAEVGDK